MRIRNRTQIEYHFWHHTWEDEYEDPIRARSLRSLFNYVRKYNACWNQIPIDHEFMITRVELSANNYRRLARWTIEKNQFIRIDRQHLGRRLRERPDRGFHANLKLVAAENARNVLIYREEVWRRNHTLGAHSPYDPDHDPDIPF